MGKHKKAILGLTLLSLTFSFIFSQTTQPIIFPDINPLFLVETKSQNSSLSSKETIFTALKFSLCPENSSEWQQSMKCFEKLHDYVTSNEFMTLPEIKRAEAILDLMYNEVLTNYRENETTIQAMFTKGEYNCVSSSILYMALAKAAEIPVTGQKTPDHAFCQIHVDGKKIDVETTNPYGFNPGTKKALSSSGNGTNYAVVPKRFYSGRQSVSDKVFVSLVGGNLCSLLMDKKDYSTAVPLAIARYVFVEGEESSAAAFVRQEGDIVCTNYVNNLQKQGQDAQALQWADMVVSKWGTTKLWQQNIDATVHNAVVRCLNKKDLQTAQNFFSAWEGRLSANTDETIRTNIFTSLVETETSGLTADMALKKLAQLDSHPYAKLPKATNFLKSTKEYFWQEKVMAVTKDGHYLQGASIAQQGIDSIGTSRNLTNLKKQCLNNYAVTIHNQFASLANDGQYQQAYEILEQGLKELPGNKTLKADMARLKKIMEQ